MKQLLLVGGGHSQVEVIRQLGRNPLAAIQVTLISPDRHTPYSGMLPGFVSGHYTLDECHIDLEQLCRAAGVAFHRDEVLGIEPNAGRVLRKDGSVLTYDLVSIDIGSTPPVDAVAGALEHGIRVKPVAQFLKAWDALRAAAEQTGRAPRIVVVGGGAGGVELALALHHRLRASCRARGPEIHIVTDAPTLLAGHAPGVIRIVQRIVEERGIRIHAQSRAVRLEPGRLYTDRGESYDADYFIWTTGAAAPRWPAAGGLKTDERGFISVNATLQSVSHPNVFAAGDIASMVGRSLPKSGVFAVRQGALLANNLRRALDSATLAPYVPQRTALALISAGNRYAVASYDNLALEGAWVWRWKDFIDRRFMRKYRIMSERR